MIKYQLQRQRIVKKIKKYINEKKKKSKYLKTICNVISQEISRVGSAWYTTR